VPAVAIVQGGHDNQRMADTTYRLDTGRLTACARRINPVEQAFV